MYSARRGFHGLGEPEKLQCQRSLLRRFEHARPAGTTRKRASFDSTCRGGCRDSGRRHIACTSRCCRPWQASCRSRTRSRWCGSGSGRHTSPPRRRPSPRSWPSRLRSRTGTSWPWARRSAALASYFSRPSFAASSSRPMSSMTPPLRVPNIFRSLPSIEPNWMCSNSTVVVAPAARLGEERLEVKRLRGTHDVEHRVRLPGVRAVLGSSRGRTSCR